MTVDMRMTPRTALKYRPPHRHNPAHTRDQRHQWGPQPVILTSRNNAVIAGMSDERSRHRRGNNAPMDVKPRWGAAGGPARPVGELVTVRVRPSELKGLAQCA